MSKDELDLIDLYEQLLEDLKKYSKVYVYGAQAMAYGIACALVCRGMTVDGYVVSSPEGNPKMIDGIMVMPIGDVDYNDNYCFVIAVPEYLHSEIILLLKQAGFMHYVCIDSKIEYELMKEYFKQNSKLKFIEDYNVVSKKKYQLEIYTAVSGKDRKLANRIVFPNNYYAVQAGTVLDRKIVADYYDSNGENISEKNRNFAELTVTYWVWKNRHTDIKGIAHYRRYLDLTAEEREAICYGLVDVILPLPFICYPDTSSQYLRYNHAQAIEAMYTALDEKDYGLADKARKILQGRILYNYNMLIARGEVFDAYCEWMFPILFRVEELCEGLMKEDKSPDRLCGHLGEILTSLYFCLRADELNIIHARKVWLI